MSGNIYIRLDKVHFNSELMHTATWISGSTNHLWQFYRSAYVYIALSELSHTVQCHMWVWRG